MAYYMTCEWKNITVHRIFSLVHNNGKESNLRKLLFIDDTALVVDSEEIPRQPTENFEKKLGNCHEVYKDSIGGYTNLLSFMFAFFLKYRAQGSQNSGYSKHWKKFLFVLVHYEADFSPIQFYW